MPENTKDNILRESSPPYRIGAREHDFLTLDDSLTMTPWERILANDDIVNFGDSLRAAMEKRNAKSC